MYLGLGSNLGDKQENIRQAIALIGERVGRVVRQSSLIETEPWGFESENKFLNGVILVETTLTPRQLLRATQKIERELGRKKHISHLLPLTSKFLIIQNQHRVAEATELIAEAHSFLIGLINEVIATEGAL